MTKHIHVSTRHVCRTMLTEYVGNKAHTGFYTPCLSYNVDRVCRLQSTYRFLHAVFVSMLTECVQLIQFNFIQAHSVNNDT